MSLGFKAASGGLITAIREYRVRVRVTRDQVRRLSEKAAVPVDPLWRIARETAERTVEAWRDHDLKRLLPVPVGTAIDSHIEEVAGGLRCA